MYEFSAIHDDNTGKITITSNTYWSCTSEGNFMLSNYSGIGDDEIEIDVPQDVAVAEGTITFSYGDDRCIYPVMKIYEGNVCYIMTVPMFMMQNGKRHIYFHFENKGDIFPVEIMTSTYSMDSWQVKETNNAYAITSDDLLTLISKESDGYVIIGPKNCDSDDFDITIHLCGSAEEIVEPEPPEVPPVEPEEPDEPEPPIEPDEPTPIEYDIIANVDLTCKGGNIKFSAIPKTIAPA